MSNREQRAASFTDQGQLKPLSWGRARIAKHAADSVAELTDEDGASVAAMVYLMDFDELKSIPTPALVERAVAFADELDASLVIACGQAFGRDMSALEASEVRSAGGGKTLAEEVPSLSPMQDSSQRACA